VENSCYQCLFSIVVLNACSTGFGLVSVSVQRNQFSLRAKFDLEKLHITRLASNMN